MFLLMTYISIFYISCFWMRVVLCSHIERMWASWIVNSGWYAALELAVTLAPLFRITFIASLFARSSFLVIIFVIIFGHHFWWSFLSSFLGKIFWLLHKWIFSHHPHCSPICKVIILDHHHHAKGASNISTCVQCKSDSFWTNMTSKPVRFHDLRLPPPSCSSILDRHVLEIYDLLMNSVIAPFKLVPVALLRGEACNLFNFTVTAC